MAFVILKIMLCLIPVRLNIFWLLWSSVKSVSAVCKGRSGRGVWGLSVQWSAWAPSWS